MKIIELKAKFCENSTVTPAEFEQIFAGGTDWGGYHVYQLGIWEFSKFFRPVPKMVYEYPHRRLSPPGDYPHRRISLPENIPTGDYPHHKSERSPLRTYVHELRASHNVYVVWK